jgi:hypothetical protein
MKAPFRVGRNPANPRSFTRTSKWTVRPSFVWKLSIDSAKSAALAAITSKSGQLDQPVGAPAPKLPARTSQTAA